MVAFDRVHRAGAGVSVLLAVLFASACGGGTSTSPPPTATPSATANPLPTPSAETVRIYLVRDGKVGATNRTVRGGASAADALGALFQGAIPTADQAAQLSTAVPGGTHLLGSSLSGNTLAVNLSPEFAGGTAPDLGIRLAQVVYTATQFPDVQQVDVRIGDMPAVAYAGVPAVYSSPVGRADLEQWTPAILVEEPTPGDRLTSPMRVFGTANVFEAQFHVGIMSPGAVMLVDRMVTAASGSGTRGAFDVTVPFSMTGSVNVIAWDVSMKDGSRIDEVYIPLQLH